MDVRTAVLDAGTLEQDCLAASCSECICVGDQWDFYVIYGLEGPDAALSEGCVWGPLQI
ncbi:hypothetical protein BDV10DRAFT_166018 [Aspergillus recurvatus]